MLRLEAFLKQTKRSNMIDQISIELCYDQEDFSDSLDSLQPRAEASKNLLMVVLRPLG